MSDDVFRFEVDDLQREFLEELRFMLDSVEESFLKLDAPQTRQQELTNIFRVLHSIKGAAGAVGFEDLGAFAHVVEDLLQVLRVEPNLVSRETVTLLLKSIDMIKSRGLELAKGIKLIWNVSEISEQLKKLTQACLAQVHNAKPAAAAEEVSPLPAAASAASVSVAAAPKSETPAGAGSGAVADDAGRLLKVDVMRVTNVIELVGELVTIKSQILRDPALKASHTLRTAVDLLDKTVRELHDEALGLRMTSLKTTFKKVQRIARDLSVKLEKPVALAIEGEDTEMDRNLTETITDPLVHLIRNAIDHGIENKQKRLAAGKPEVGMIAVSARQQSGRIIIEIRDDGGGIDRQRVLAKARANGIISADRPDSDISDREAFTFIFAPGFSTAEKVTDVSGRGVGLDVVKTNILKMKGSIEIDSKIGHGTLFRLSLPLTTAITEGILAESAGRKFILPLDRMRELIQSRDLTAVSFAAGGSVVRVRDQMIPYLSLKEALCGVKPQRKDNVPAEETLVVMETAHTLVALAVDRVISQTQVVLKPLDRTFTSQPEISGATILGDGSVALVLDIDGLLSILSLPGAQNHLSGAA